jgi:hypothetical protein
MLQIQKKLKKIKKISKNFQKNAVRARICNTFVTLSVL